MSLDLVEANLDCGTAFVVIAALFRTTEGFNPRYDAQARAIYAPARDGGGWPSPTSTRADPIAANKQKTLPPPPQTNVCERNCNAYRMV